MQNVLRQLADASQVNPALTSLQVLQAVKPLVIRQLQAENAPAQKVAAMKVALDKFDAQLNARSAQYMQQLGKEAVQAYGVYTLGLLGKQLGKYDYLNLQVYARPHFFMLVILKMMYDAGFVDISVLPNAFAFMGKIYMRGFTDYIMTYVEEALRQLPRYFPYAAF